MGEDVSWEIEVGGIGVGDYFVFVVEIKYGYDGVKDFFLGDSYFVGDIGKDCGSYEKFFYINVFVICDEVCVFFFVFGDIV